MTTPDLLVIGETIVKLVQENQKLIEEKDILRAALVRCQTQTRRAEDNHFRLQQIDRIVTTALERTK